LGRPAELPQREPQNGREGAGGFNRDAGVVKELGGGNPKAGVRGESGEQLVDHTGRDLGVRVHKEDEWSGICSRHSCIAPGTEAPVALVGGDGHPRGVVGRDAFSESGRQGTRWAVIDNDELAAGLSA